MARSNGVRALAVVGTSGWAACHWLAGAVGAAPEVGWAYPCQIALSMPGWSMASLQGLPDVELPDHRNPTCGLLKLGWAYWMPNDQKRLQASRRCPAG